MGDEVASRKRARSHSPQADDDEDRRQPLKQQRYVPSDGEHASDETSISDGLDNTRVKLPLQTEQAVAHVAFMQGNEIAVPITSECTIGDLRAKVCAHKSTPIGTMLKLFHQELGKDVAPREVKDSELALPLQGLCFTAIYTRALSLNAREFWQRSGLNWLDLDEPPYLGLLEVKHVADAKDAEALAEVLMCCQPRRMVLHQVCPWLQHVIDNLDRDVVTLESCELHGLLMEGLPHVASFLRRCPSMQVCKLRESDFSADDVRDLRQQVSPRVSVVI